jgi:Telomere capping, CST complex subunit
MLQHDSKSVRVDVSVLVDDLVLISGQWVNVIGYYETDSTNWIVRAVLLWPVPPTFNLPAYETALQARTSIIL